MRKNAMEISRESLGKINTRYDMRAKDMESILNGSSNIYEMISNGFQFGYMQGMKAAKAQMKGGVA